MSNWCRWPRSAPIRGSPSFFFLCFIFPIFCVFRWPRSPIRGIASFSFSSFFLYPIFCMSLTKISADKGFSFFFLFSFPQFVHISFAKIRADKGVSFCFFLFVLYICMSLMGSWFFFWNFWQVSAWHISVANCREAHSQVCMYVCREHILHRENTFYIERTHSAGKLILKFDTFSKVLSRYILSR